jgi:hypothetical protein
MSIPISIESEGFQARAAEEISPELNQSTPPMSRKIVHVDVDASDALGEPQGIPELSMSEPIVAKNTPQHSETRAGAYLWKIYKEWKP